MSIAIYETVEYATAKWRYEFCRGGVAGRPDMWDVCVFDPTRRVLCVSKSLDEARLVVALWENGSNIFAYTQRDLEALSIPCGDGI